jgi:ABC-type uncharacterized transport system substrate-binding protein
MAPFRARGNHMERREFIAGLGAAATWPLAARGQTANLPRIGFLRFSAPASAAGRVEEFRTALRSLGYVEGRNIVIEYRFAETTDQLADMAAELARMKVDVIFAMSSTETERACQATKTIPIVFAVHADPVGLGHVASLAKPGGNATGLTSILTDMVAKQLEIFNEAVPQATRMGLLFSPSAPSHRPALQALETTGSALGFKFVMVPLNTLEDLESGFATLTRDRAGGFLVLAGSFTFAYRDRLAELALKHRLPGMFGSREYVDAGGLMNYSPNLSDMVRRAAIYVDKILKGAKPADLPVEQASKFELVVNNRTAKAIGLTLAPAFLLRADQVIE